MNDTPAFQCAISADYVRRALFVANDEETRYYLSGVHVSPHPERGAYIVATDGAAFVCFHDEKAQISGEMILCPDEALRAALADQYGDREPRLLVARKDLLVVAAVDYADAETVLAVPNPLVLAAQFQGCTIDGKYPDWRRILYPIAPDAPAPQVDARKLHAIGKALSEGNSRSLNLCAAKDSHTPVAWVFGGIKTGFGILAGTVDETVQRARPKWLVLPNDTAGAAIATSETKGLEQQ